MKYFIISNDVQQGPFSPEELSLQRITSDTLVWAEGMAQWTPAWQVEELKSLLYGQPTGNSMATPPPPPPINTTVNMHAQQYSHASTSEQQQYVQQKVPQKRRHTGCIWAAIILIGLLVFMGVTNPSKDEHRMVIKENVTRGLSKAMSNQDNSLISQGMGMLSQMLAGPIINEALDNMLQYHNYLIFSTTSIATKDGDSTTSYGVFGKVFTADEEKIASYISSAIGELPRNMLNGLGMDDEQDSHDNDVTSQADPNDTLSLGKQIGNVVIDHVGRQVKKQIQESTDSATSNSVGSLVDDVVNLIKGI